MIFVVAGLVGIALLIFSPVLEELLASLFEERRAEASNF